MIILFNMDNNCNDTYGKRRNKIKIFIKQRRLRYPIGDSISAKIQGRKESFSPSVESMIIAE